MQTEKSPKKNSKKRRHRCRRWIKTKTASWIARKCVRQELAGRREVRAVQRDVDQVRVVLKSVDVAQVVLVLTANRQVVRAVLRGVGEARAAPVLTVLDREVLAARGRDLVVRDRVVRDRAQWDLPVLNDSLSMRWNLTLTRTGSLAVRN